jgi:hypothetical protein
VPLAAGFGEHGTRHCLLRLSITGHQQPPAEHVDPLIELVVGVWDRASETGRDDDLDRG